MSLDIRTSDDELYFHIGYIGSITLRSFFVVYYGESLYNDYMELVKWSMSFFNNELECPIDEDKFDEQLGDLSILINHSDCDGELSSDECKLLTACLFVNEDKIRSLEIYNNNPEHVDRIINRMYEFKELINYCANHDGVKLIFG